MRRSFKFSGYVPFNWMEFSEIETFNIKVFFQHLIWMTYAKINKKKQVRRLLISRNIVCFTSNFQTLHKT